MPGRLALNAMDRERYARPPAGGRSLSTRTPFLLAATLPNFRQSVRLISAALDDIPAWMRGGSRRSRGRRPRPESPSSPPGVALRFPRSAEGPCNALAYADSGRTSVDVRRVATDEADPRRRPPSTPGRSYAAWNLHCALYYKAGGVPWQLRRESTDPGIVFRGGQLLSNTRQGLDYIRVSPRSSISAVKESSSAAPRRQLGGFLIRFCQRFGQPWALILHASPLGDP